MRISDWSSDVCSSDLAGEVRAASRRCHYLAAGGQRQRLLAQLRQHELQARARLQDRQRPVSPPLGDVAVVHHLGRRPWAAVQRALLPALPPEGRRSEEHTSELQSLMRISYAVFCLKKKK